jgi:hypothetical protein
MRKATIVLVMFCLTASSFGGFKVKLVKPKKPEKYQIHTTIEGVTFEADLLLKGKEHKKFFYKELDRSNIIVLRLAIFNRSSGEVVLPLHDLELLAPDGTGLTPVAPDAVAQAALRGLVVMPIGADMNPPVTVSPTVRSGDPRSDPSDPRYDPRYDPTRPGYDPNDPRVRRDGRHAPWYRPGVDVVLSPGGGSVGDVTQFEKALVEKDFEDKAHPFTPIPRNSNRDKFIYFSMADAPKTPSAFILRLPRGKGIPEPIELKFQ